MTALPHARHVAVTAGNGALALAVLNAEEPQSLEGAIAAAYSLLGELFTAGATEAHATARALYDRSPALPADCAARFDGAPTSYRRRHLDAVREVVDHLEELGRAGGAR